MSHTHTLPFSVLLEQYQDDGPVECESLLRHVPGKRDVYKGTWRQSTILVKFFQDPASARRHWSRELSGVKAMRAAAVKTPELIHSGRTVDGTPILIFEYLPDAQTALNVWNGLSSDETRMDFLRKLVELLAQMHEAGLEQKDLHLDNFLIVNSSVYAIDGDAVSGSGHDGPLKLGASSGNLALFFAQFPPVFDYLLEEAVRYYLECRNTDIPDLLDALKNKLPGVRRRRRLKYVRKCYRSCSEFVRANRPGQASVCRRDRQGPDLSSFFADPDEFMNRGTILKNGNSSTVVRVQGQDYDWVIKRYNIKGFFHAISRSFRPTRAWISWGNAHRLRISGITSPLAIALVEKRFGPFRSKGYYVSEFIAGPHALAYFTEQTAPKSDRQMVADEFVRFFSFLKSSLIRHGDCKATNFVIKDYRPWVLDLDSMCEYRPGADFEKVYQDDRARFLLNWTSQPTLRSWFDKHLP